MLLATRTDLMVSPDSDEWVPPGWGTDEENAEEGKAFAAWTRGMRPVDD